MASAKNQQKYYEKFNSTYYKNKYVSKLCKITKEESKRLDKILKDNNIGFTEFVRSCIEMTEGKKIVIEKRLE